MAASRHHAHVESRARYISSQPTRDTVTLETTASPLAPWESFYVIVGSSGAALIGLQFVVLTLIADSDVVRSKRTIGTFGTPIVTHFGAALLVSATMSAPWPSMWSVA